MNMGSAEGEPAGRRKGDARSVTPLGAASLALTFLACFAAGCCDGDPVAQAEVDREIAALTSAAETPGPREPAQVADWARRGRELAANARRR